MALESSSNSDLHWDLDDIQDKDAAKNFVLKFQKALCVYSPSVEQVYSNYGIYFPRDENSKMVVLPNDGAYHDTFQRINREAVIKTGLHIIPGQIIRKEGLQLAIPSKVDPEKLKFMAFKSGLLGILKQINKADPFLPILAKGDLREFEEQHPSLHLHKIQLSQLTDRSALERSSLKTTIKEKLIKFYKSL